MTIPAACPAFRLPDGRTVTMRPCVYPSARAPLRWVAARSLVADYDETDADNPASVRDERAAVPLTRAARELVAWAQWRR